MTPDTQEAAPDPQDSSGCRIRLTCANPGCAREFWARPKIGNREEPKCCSPGCRGALRILRKAEELVIARQVPLDFTPPTAPLPKVNSTVAPVARQRLQRKAVAILERLYVGEATNTELAQIGGFRFGARLGEIREHLRWLHGIGRAWDPIVCVENKATGEARYRLVEALRVMADGVEAGAIPPLRIAALLPGETK